MKMLLSALMSMLLYAGAGWAADKPAPPSSALVKGEVLEVKDVETYTYLRL